MKNLNLKKNKSNGLLFLGGTIVATLVISLLGFQSVFAMISSQLDLGDRGAEVTELQTYLSTDSTIYPSGLVTGYFGQLTKAGVERFQDAQGIVSSGTPATTGYGRVGPRTQAAINAKLAGGWTTGADINAPLINSVSVNTSSNGASVSWTASEASMGKVYYSTSPIRIGNIFDVNGIASGEPTVSGTLAQYDGVARSAHTVNISNLSSNTFYYYLVVIFDASKNISISSPAYFQTN